jgi:hypothetical protein
LFLVDRKNLGEQAEQEFMAYLAHESTWEKYMTLTLTQLVILALVVQGGIAWWCTSRILRAFWTQFTLLANVDRELGKVVISLEVVERDLGKHGVVAMKLDEIKHALNR